jgi:hypothetical protein
VLIEMKVAGLALDPMTNAPIVILKDTEEKKVLPIWIGLLEASAIAMELEKIPFTRPMTHDLISVLLKELEASIARIEISDLKENIFYATIHLSTDGKTRKIDSRPSDAIAIALRTKATIFVDSEVIEKSKKVDIKGDLASGEGDKKKWAEMLEELSPEAFGKYKM